MAVVRKPSLGDSGFNVAAEALDERHIAVVPRISGPFCIWWRPKSGHFFFRPPDLFLYLGRSM